MVAAKQIPVRPKDPMRQSNMPIRAHRGHLRLLVVFQVFLGIILVLVFPNGHSQTDAFAFSGIYGTRNVASRESTTTATSATATTATATPRHSRLILQGFLDGLFGGGDDSGEKGNDATAILATIDVRTFDANDESILVGFDSLSDYITEKWMDLFQTKSISLTTPVKVFKRSDRSKEQSDSDSNSETETIADSANCRLVFQKIDTGYKADKDKDDDTKDKKKEEVKQGGVEILVQKVVSGNAKQSLRVIARRCEVDDDTMIKEMSEEIILKELQTAIAVWKKEATF